MLLSVFVFWGCSNDDDEVKNEVTLSFENLLTEENSISIQQCILNQYMIVEFYCLIRKEKPFASKEELIAQLYEDKQKVREYFKPQDKCPMV